MSKFIRLRTITIATFAAATFVGASAFADSRHLDGTAQDDPRGGYSRQDRGAVENRGFRENERVTTEGRITSIDRERDGYRVRLDRGGYGFWVPESTLRDRRSDFRVGISVRLGGIFRGGMVRVDAVDWPDQYGRRDDRRFEDRRDRDVRRMRGFVERVDYRRELLVVRDEATRRLVTIDMNRTDDRRGGLDIRDLRRGDRVELTGDWGRNGTFRAYRIDALRKGR